MSFQSTYLYKVRRFSSKPPPAKLGFNPRTYIRYDRCFGSGLQIFLFQSTYLYKVRLYATLRSLQNPKGFNPRTYIRYDFQSRCCNNRTYGFQSTYLYKVRHSFLSAMLSDFCFNPRTYIRYDCITNNANIYSLLSMHLCDNKLFGFFIDEIKLIGVFNRLIINDCENSSFLLMLNVRKQLYYKFIFYIIGCDDTYVFNSFRIIISQEIETNTIFFMIDDIR